MKIKNIILSVFFGVTYGCNHELSRIHEDDIMLIANSYTYFDDRCLEVFENAFLKHEVWSEDSKIIDACVFEPKEFLNSKMCDEDGIYLRVRLEDSSSIIREHYWYNTCYNGFIPIHVKNERLYLDTMFLVMLYFETELNCASRSFTGTDSDERYKNGVFKREIDD